MTTTINNKYGKLTNSGNIEYAPSSIQTETGIILNPSEAMYLKRGWYKIVNEQPQAESGCYVKFNGYEKDDEEKTITFKYVQIMIPITKEVYTYSKLKLEVAIFNINKTQEFDDFIDQTMISNDFGSEVALRKFYDQAQELKSDNEYFETYLKIGQEKLGLDDETLSSVLEYSKITA